MIKSKEFEAKAEKRPENRAEILGVGVNSTSISEVLRKIAEKRKKLMFIVTVNTEMVVEAQEDKELKTLINNADLALPDGNGLKLAVAGLEIIHGRRLVEELVKRKYRIFYLGGKTGVAKEMAQKYGGEWDEGEKSIRAGEQESVRMVNKINKYRPDILLVAYGVPWEEKWIWRNRSKIKAKVAMGVGGTFDYLTGRAKLPPQIVEKWGVEWLWRLIHEPWRWRRQLRLVEFVGRVLMDRVSLWLGQDC